MKNLSGPGLFVALRGLSRHGLLAYVGQLWHTHGDTFQLRLGLQRLIFAIHPDSVRQINSTNRQNYDKLHSYDSVRRYLTGEGLVASTGSLWRRQRKLMAPFFTPRGVEAYADVMLRDGVRLLERWEGLARSGSTVEIGEEMTLVTAPATLHPAGRQGGAATVPASTVLRPGRRGPRHHRRARRSCRKRGDAVALLLGALRPASNLATPRSGSCKARSSPPTVSPCESTRAES